MKPWAQSPAPHKTGMVVFHLGGGGRRMKVILSYRRNSRPALAVGDPISTKVLKGMAQGSFRKASPHPILPG